MCYDFIVKMSDNENICLFLLTPGNVGLSAPNNQPSCCLSTQAIGLMLSDKGLLIRNRNCANYYSLTYEQIISILLSCKILSL